MEMMGEVRLAASRQLVWDALNDPEVLRASIPGCEALAKTSDTEYSAVVISKVGPIKARFEGKVTLSNIAAPVSYTLSGEGQGGMAGFAKADIEVALEPIEERVTLVRYGVKANVGGKLAQLGARMIDATARKSADDFFKNFSVEVARRAGEVPPVHGQDGIAPLPFSPQVANNLPHSATPVARSTRTSGSQSTSASIVPSVPSPALLQEISEVWTAGQIKVWVADKIAVVTLNRPEKRNAMTYAMWRAIPGIFASLDQNPEVRVIVLTGAADDFCAGADISEFAKRRSDIEQGTEYEVAVDACCDAIAYARKPTIAVVNGYCLGGGAHLAMSCDFRYASAAAKFGIPSARLSVIYGVKGTQKLLNLVGLVAAKRILFSSRRFDADEALRLGFVDHVAKAPLPAKARWWQKSAGSLDTALVADPMVDARKFARTLGENAPLSIYGAKMILNGLATGTGALDEQQAEALIAEAVASHDYREGRTAFVEKREPAFKGN